MPEFIHSIFVWFSKTSLAYWLHETPAAFPIVEAVHLIALAAFLGTSLLLSLRALGFCLPKISYRDLSQEFLPLAMVSFVLLLSSGILLVGSNVMKYYGNQYFRVKIALLFLAIVGHFVSDLVLRRRASMEQRMGQKAFLPLLSLGLWSCVAFAGRAIGLF